MNQTNWTTTKTRTITKRNKASHCILQLTTNQPNYFQQTQNLMKVQQIYLKIYRLFKKLCLMNLIIPITIWIKLLLMYSIKIIQIKTKKKGELSFTI